MVNGNDTRPALALASLDGDGRTRGHVEEIQRARILGAALQAIDRFGYTQFTVAQVIERAKVSRKTFYDVFEDREDCFVALFEQALARAQTRVEQACDRREGWRERMRAGLAAILEMIDEEPALARLCVVDALAGGRRVLERRELVLSRLRSAVQGGAAERDGRREPAEVTAEGVVGAVFAVLHARLLQRSKEPYVELQGQLMSMIVLPYLGPAAARRELARPPARVAVKGSVQESNPLKQLDMRLTYRTVRVLMAVAEGPGSSNRNLADAAGVADPGQISKLLGRLHKLGLVENAKGTSGRGEPNAWILTEAGWRVHHALAQQATSA
jgi:AcrR family transcriptional regulator/DNA-binding MarR family transcriptional regulator